MAPFRGDADPSFRVPGEDDSTPQGQQLELGCCALRWGEDGAKLSPPLHFSSFSLVFGLNGT